MDCTLFATFLAIVAAGAGSFAIGSWIATLRHQRAETAMIDPEEQEGVMDVLAGLQRSVKLLQGRVNNISPPRAGTGKQNGEEEAPTAVAGPQLTRAQVLQAWKLRGGR